MAVDPHEEPPERRLRELATASGPVHVVARVVLVRRREVERRTDGSRLPLLSGILSDGTAGVRFTWWDPPREGIERGSIVRLVGAEVRSFRGRPELVISWKTRVGPAGPAELPRLDGDEIPLRTVREIRAEDEGFRLRVRVVRVAQRTVSIGEERREVYDGLLGDRSGVVAFTSWSDFGLRGGEAVEVDGAYVRVFRQRPSVVLDERSMVRRIDAADLPSPEAVLTAPPRPIADWEEDGGGAAVGIEGVVVGLVPPSGLVYRCARCRRTVTGGVCRVHGRVEPVADLRARLVVDDGTASATVSAGRADTERLWGVALPAVLARLQEHPDPTVFEPELLGALLGRRLRVRGAASCDDFGLTIEPESIEAVEVDLESAAAELSARLEAR